MQTDSSVLWIGLPRRPPLPASLWSNWKYCWTTKAEHFGWRQLPWPAIRIVDTGQHFVIYANAPEAFPMTQ